MVQARGLPGGVAVDGRLRENRSELVLDGETLEDESEKAVGGKAQEDRSVLVLGGMLGRDWLGFRSDWVHCDYAHFIGDSAPGVDGRSRIRSEDVPNEGGCVVGPGRSAERVHGSGCLIHREGCEVRLLNAACLLGRDALPPGHVVTAVLVEEPA